MVQDEKQKYADFRAQAPLPSKNQREVNLEIWQTISTHHEYRAYVQHIMYMQIVDEIGTM